MFCHLVLGAALVGSAGLVEPVGQDSEEQINPVPRLQVPGETIRLSFEQDTAGFRAMNECTLKIAGGVLVVESQGHDPFFHRVVDSPAEWHAVTIRLRTQVSGAGAVYWSTPRSPGYDESRVRSFRLEADGHWHEYRVIIPTPGGLKSLRIDPGTAPGIFEIAWVRIEPFYPHPLAFGPVKTSADHVALPLRNLSERSVAYRFQEKSFTLVPGGEAVLSQPLVRSAPLELGSLEITPEGLPPLKRSIFVYHDDWAVRWVDCPAEEPAPFRLQWADGFNLLRIQQSGKTLAIIGPIAAPGSPLGPGLIDKLPPLSGKLVGATLQLEGDEVAARVTVRGQEIHFELKGRRVIEGPVVRFFGGLEQGLFAGLEYLGKNERSSSKLDIETEEHIRFAPDRLKVTMPLMGFVTDQGAVTLTWHDMTLQPIYATPNFFDGTPDHRFSLRGERIEAVLRIASGNLEDQILWYLTKFGLPELPRRPRSPQEQAALCLWALTEGPLRNAEGWGHCVEPNWRRQFFVDMASTVWVLSGELPEVPQLVPNGAHIPNEVAYLLTGRAQQWLTSLKQQAEHLIRQQQPDGSYRYRGEFARGHFEDTASGHCARPAAALLEIARLTGDQRALEAGLKTLEFMKRFRTPRGAQIWEIPLHTPDILASAELVRAYVRGYELSGNAEYLAQARRWALSGVPFVYLWGEYPVMKYATIPVYGATHWKAPNWMGLPVQWCGLVYAYTLTMLAPYDRTVDWKHLAQGILIAGQQMQVPREEGPNAGLLPDAFALRAQRRQGPMINPCALVSLDRALRGELERVAVAIHGSRRVVAPFPVEIRDGQAIVRGKPGLKYQVIIDGSRIVDVESTGEDRIPLD